MTVHLDVSPDKLVEAYIQLRDAKKLAEDKYKEFVQQHFAEPMERLEAQMLEALNALGIDSIKGSTGTVYKKTNSSVTIADQREFRRHVIGAEEWDLIDWRASKTAINDLVERGEPLPPGINRSTFVSVGVRKKG